MDDENEAVVFTEPGTVAIEERATPTPGDGQVQIGTSVSLVSPGTEATILSGDFPDGSQWERVAEYPFVPGYANVGTVADRGDDVTDFEVGDRVVSFAPHARQVVARVEDCRAVPESVSDAEAAFFATAEVVMNAVRRGRVTWGESAAVFGLGLIGQLTARILHFAGSRPVIGLNTSRPRLDLLPDRPGFVPVHVSDSSWVEETKRHAGGDGVPVAFEATGDGGAIPDQLDVLRREGRLVVLGSPGGATELDFHDDCNWPSYEFIGAHVSSHPTADHAGTTWTARDHAELFFDAVGDPPLADLESLVGRRAAYRQAPSVYDAVCDPETHHVGYLFEW